MLQSTVRAPASAAAAPRAATSLSLAVRAGATLASFVVGSFYSAVGHAQALGGVDDAAGGIAATLEALGTPILLIAIFAAGIMLALNKISLGWFAAIVAGGWVIGNATTVAEWVQF